MRDNSLWAALLAVEMERLWDVREAEVMVAW